MTHFTRQLPAWVLTRLPVAVARECTNKSAPEAAPTKDQTVLQLLVDVSVIHQSDARTGIQRVVRALLLQLLQSPPAGYRICPVYATRQDGYRYAETNFLQKPRQAAHVKAHEVQVRKGDLFLALDLAAHLLPRRQAQLLQWKRSGVALHVLVYDLLPLLHPEWFNPKTTRNFNHWMRWIAIYADSAICISDTVKTELRTWLKARFGMLSCALPARTIVLGADIEASAPSDGLPENAEALLAHLRSTTAVLMVGTIEPRKGYDQSLAAFEQIWRQSGPRPSLVLVGRPGWKTEALQESLRNHPEAGKHLFWLENVSDQYLNCLYAACRGVLVASRAEGFGLPLIEASLHGKPVLARDLPVFREMKLPDLTYFEDNTPQELADTLIQWLSRPTPPAPSHISEPQFPTWQLSAFQLMRALGFHGNLEFSTAVTTAAVPINARASTSSPFKSVT